MKIKFYPSLVIVVIGLLAYANSLQGDFILDSRTCIRDNPHIRSLWPLSEAISLPLWNTGESLDGRPFLSLSFALNHAVFGPAAWGYHLVNLLIHIGAALVLFGIIRAIAERWRPGASTTGIALAVAVLWVVHPLQTQSVTYMIQRAESMTGLFYLLTLYCSIRGIRGSGRWFAGSILFCLLGAGTKESIATAPLVVLLYDAMFEAGSPIAALRKRKGLYAGLCLSWVVLAGLILLTPHTKVTDWQGTAPLDYALTQAGVILHYLRLTVLPYPLALDYAWPVATPATAVLPILAVLVMVAAAVWGVWRRHWAGFAGASFFVILAPTSSILPLAPQDLVAEHRMYLPLAAVLALIVGGVLALFERLARATPRRRRVQTGVIIVVIGCVGLGALTLGRNREYGDPLTFWMHNLDRLPRSDAARQFVNDALCEQGRYEEAVAYCQRAVDLQPDSYSAHCDLAMALTHLERFEEAVQHLEKARKLDPDSHVAYEQMGRILLRLKRHDEAIGFFERALELEPASAPAHCTLGNVFAEKEKWEDASKQYRQAIALDPSSYSARSDLGYVLARQGRIGDAITEYREALQLARQEQHVPAAQQIEARLALLTRAAGNAPTHSRGESP